MVQRNLGEMLIGDNPTKGIFWLDRGTHKPYLAFLTRAELYHGW